MTAVTLFGATPTISDPDNAEDTYSMASGITFGVAGQIVGARIWGASNAIVTSPSGAVYTTGGSQQAVKALVGYATAAWNTVMFDTPVDVSAGATYDIAFGPINRYAANSGTFPRTSGDLTGTQGRFISSAVLAFPTSVSGGGTGSTWFGIDVLFEAAASFTGVLAATTPLPVAALTGTVATAGQLAATTPLPVAELAAAVALTGVLAGVTPLPVAAIALTSESDEGTGMNVAAVMQDIADRLDTIPGLRVFSGAPGAVVPPAAVVPYPTRIVYDATYGRGSDQMEMAVIVVVGKASARSTPARLGAYANSSGPRSVKQALDTGTYTAFDTLRVSEATFDAVSIGGTEYMAALFDIELAGPGGGT